MLPVTGNFLELSSSLAEIGHSMNQWPGLPGCGYKTLALSTRLEVALPGLHSTFSPGRNAEAAAAADPDKLAQLLLVANRCEEDIELNFVV